MQPRGILGICAVALGLAQCHTYPTGSPEAESSPCSPRGYLTVSFEELVLNLRRYESQRVAVDGYILPTGTGCDKDPCDVSCTVDAKLAASPGALDPSRALFLVSASGSGFGHCRPDPQCQLKCDPPAKTELRVLGTVGTATQTPGEAYISVDRYCQL